jgi:hypothetical protein
MGDEATYRTVSAGEVELGQVVLWDGREYRVLFIEHQQIGGEPYVSLSLERDGSTRGEVAHLDYPLQVRER